MALPRRAKIRIWGLQGNIISVGGYAQILPGQNPPRWRRVWGGKAWGWVEGRQECQAELDWLRVGGIGLSLHLFWASSPFVCEDGDCAFDNGNEVTLEVITIFLIAFRKVTMRFCETKRVSWGIGFGLGLGWQGATWQIKNTRSW